jgi:hypothetical protein
MMITSANEMVGEGSSDDDDYDYDEDDADPGPKTNADSITNQNMRNRMVHSNSLRQIIEEEEGQVEGENGNGGGDRGQDEDDEMSMSNSVAHTAGQGNDLDGTRTAQLLRDANGYLTLGASTLGRGMTHVAFTVAGATSNVVGGAADLVVSVAAITPGLKSLVRPQIHTYVILIVAISIDSYLLLLLFQFLQLLLSSFLCTVSFQFYAYLYSPLNSL